jgi:hypothetical protein
MNQLDSADGSNDYTSSTTALPVSVIDGDGDGADETNINGGKSGSRMKVPKAFPPSYIGGHGGRSGRGVVASSVHPRPFVYETRYSTKGLRITGGSNHCAGPTAAADAASMLPVQEAHVGSIGRTVAGALLTAMRQQSNKVNGSPSTDATAISAEKLTALDAAREQFMRLRAAQLDCIVPPRYRGSGGDSVSGSSSSTAGTAGTIGGSGGSGGTGGTMASVSSTCYAGFGFPRIYALDYRSVLLHILSPPLTLSHLSHSSLLTPHSSLLSSHPLSSSQPLNLSPSPHSSPLTPHPSLLTPHLSIPTNICVGCNICVEYMR